MWYAITAVVAVSALFVAFKIVEAIL